MSNIISKRLENIIGTNISTSTLNAGNLTSGNIVSTIGISSGTYVGTLVSVGNLNSVNTSISNLQVSGNISAASSIATIGTIVGTTITIGTLNSSLATIGNIVALTGISSGTYTGTSVSVGTLNSSLATVGNIVALTGMSSGTYVGTLVSVGNLNSVNTSISNLQVSGNISAASSIATIGTLISANVYVSGTLTSVNITTTNLLQSSGSLIANSITVGSLLVSTGGIISTTVSSGTIFGSSSTISSLVATNISTSQLQFSANATSGILFGAGPYSRIYDNGQLHIWTDDNMYFDVGGASTSGSTCMYIGSSGNVGINTTAPQYTLDVNGTSRISITGSGTNGALLLSGSDFYGHTLYIASSALQKRLTFDHNGTTGNIFSYDYGSGIYQNLCLQGFGGNVGINNTAPNYNLDVNGSLNSSSLNSTNLTSINTTLSSTVFTGNLYPHNNVINFDSSGGAVNWGAGPYSSIYDNANLHIWTYNNMYFDVGGPSTAGNTRMYINPSGYVGINTIAPAYQLDVNGTCRISSNIDCTGTNTGALVVFGGIGSSGLSYFSKLNINNGGSNSNLGMGFRWNNSGVQGESIISWGTGQGSNPRLSFQSTPDGISYTERFSISPTGDVFIPGSLSFYNSTINGTLSVSNNATFNGTVTAPKKMQSGSVAGFATGSVTFPVAFSNSPNVTLTIFSTNFANVYVAYVTAISSTGFSYAKYYNNLAGGAWHNSISETMFWIAII